MIKNLTVRQITYYITVLITFFNILIISVLYVSGDVDLPFYWIILLIILQIIFTYLIIRQFLEYFIFRQIKLIYKFIHDSKLGSKEMLTQDKLDNTSIAEVNKEVLEWGKIKQEEIESLKSLEEYRSNFVGNISHELKTPIFSIQGYLHTLLDGGLNDDTINLKYIKRATKNAERLQSIVEDLETIHRIESENEVFHISNFNIKLLIDDLLPDLSVLAKKKKIKIKFKDGADLPYIVNADINLISEVINNLIINSIKYGKQGGTTRIGLYETGQNILIEINDDGIGIEEEHLKHVFDRFYRVDPSRSRKQGGSGLGLSIVKHVVEAHNQTINVRSTPGEGSTFGFTLKKAK
ncbi:MAG: sensor histidine kinase [Saprospiraceae bacterium]|nr:sensor histidine kinase [Saprospiraceae bacterium]